ncbi:restriction endonuclease subunit S [Rhizobium leguminosarum]|uniref:restriction endonuclease subunit S n=1 Tax=Rhizobium leguminosarum TaxID=384 RepID=UPI001040B30B|nr:restriction endonuclease subunit S [Rhizobium leguminosarum]MBY5478313.1 restriction endonuclease subunit S [Rhizobium leguminosarum]NKK15125.1 restriction endonuclease subunit S [Rhizobium leguminosarum bv. viciae]TBZ56448.1 restriction endonuclease subunit S [Rhizobium leguminosarum bv. viciae]
MNAERLLQHYEQIADAPDAIPRLRRFILDLAVRGKLVPQDVENEAVPHRYLNEQAKFKLPQNWRVLNFGRFCDIEGGNQPPKSQFISEPRDGYVQLFQIRDLGERGVPTFIPMASARSLSKQGEILIGRYGASVGKVFWAQNGAYNVALAKFIWPKDALIARFVFLLLKSDFLQMRLAVATRSAQAGFNKGDLAAIDFPIPPLTEQYRIVAKVDELMALCDALEAARTERETKRDRLAAASLARLNTPDPETFRDDARFALDALPALTARPDQIKQVRQAILNLAVRGKLVAQDPADEPAEELLKRIAAERDELVRQKTIRRDAPLEPVNAQDCPHSIPSSWTWSRVGDAVLFTQYGTSQKSHASQSGVPVLTMGNIQDGRVIWGSEKRIPERSDDLPALYLKTSDLLYNRTNSAELVGKTGIYRGQNDAKTFASYLIRLRPSLLHSSPVYLNIAMNAPCFRETQIVPLIKKQTGQANVSGSALKNMLIPLPPLAEQHRIVAKVDELMALCDQLEASLTSADETRKKLLDALLAEALAPVDAVALQDAAE